MLLGCGGGGDPRPALDAVAPSTATPGTLVWLVGRHLGAAGGGFVALAGQGVATESDLWSDDHVGFHVPAGARAGAALVVVTVGGEPSNPVFLDVAAK